MPSPFGDLSPPIDEGGTNPKLVQLAVRPFNDDTRLCRLLWGKASPFRTPPFRTTFPSQAGRLSLPACEGRNERYGLGRKAEGFPQSGAAEPHPTVARLHKQPTLCSGAQPALPPLLLMVSRQHRSAGLLSWPQFFHPRRKESTPPWGP